MNENASKTLGPILSCKENIVQPGKMSDKVVPLTCSTQVNVQNVTRVAQTNPTGNLET